MPWHASTIVFCVRFCLRHCINIQVASQNKTKTIFNVLSTLKLVDLPWNIIPITIKTANFSVNAPLIFWISIETVKTLLDNSSLWYYVKGCFNSWQSKTSRHSTVQRENTTEQNWWIETKIDISSSQKRWSSYILQTCAIFTL